MLSPPILSSKGPNEDELDVNKDTDDDDEIDKEIFVSTSQTLIMIKQVIIHSIAYVIRIAKHPLTYKDGLKMMLS